MFCLVRSTAILFLFVMGCGGAGATTGPETAPAATPRPGGAIDLVRLAPVNAVVLLHANLEQVRRLDVVRYDRIAGELIRELDLTAYADVMLALLNQADSAIGVFAPGASSQEGMLIFGGQYSDADFERVLAVASARHGSTPEPQVGADGRAIYALGNATLARFDRWTWAVAVGEGMRGHLSQVSVTGGPPFGHGLIEFGPRIGLPQDSAQAWANQDEQVGVDMVALVFAGENPQMVHNFVTTVRRHLSL